jgi:hypothetical protein
VTHTLGRTRLDERSARHRDLCLATQYSQESAIRAPGGIRTRNPSRRTTPDPRLSSHGQRVRRESSPRVQMAAWWGNFIAILCHHYQVSLLLPLLPFSDRSVKCLLSRFNKLPEYTELPQMCYCVVSVLIYRFN